jgi:aryl-alcohol dehydrogenase-like predicted oxidoreductase
LFLERRDATTPTRKKRPARLRARPGLHGVFRGLWRARRHREHRHHPCRARDKVFISIKFGALRTPDLKWNGYDLRPEAIRNFLAYSLKRLGTDYIDLYQPARLDSPVPVEDVVGTVADLVKQGYVRHVGLSEASATSIARAQVLTPVAALQIEYSLFSRGIEDAILPAIRERGIGLVAH